MGRQKGRKETSIQCSSIEGKGRKCCKKLKVASSVQEHAELCSKIKSEQCPLFEDSVIIVDLIRAGSEK